MYPQPFLTHAWSDFVQTWQKHSAWWYTCAPHFIFRSDKKWPTGRLTPILVVKKTRCWTRPQTFLGYAFTDLLQTWHTDKEWWLIIYFWDQIRDDWLAAIFWLKCVPNYFSDMHGLILFKLGTSTVHDGIHMPLTLFSEVIKDGRPTARQVAILVVHKYGLAL